MNINDSIKTHRSTFEIMKMLAIEYATNSSMIILLIYFQNTITINVDKQMS